MNLAHSKHTIYNHFGKKLKKKCFSINTEKKANDSFASLHYGYGFAFAAEKSIETSWCYGPKCHQMVCVGDCALSCEASSHG